MTLSACGWQQPCWSCLCNCRPNAAFACNPVPPRRWRGVWWHAVRPGCLHSGWRRPGRLWYAGRRPAGRPGPHACTRCCTTPAAPSTGGHCGDGLRCCVHRFVGLQFMHFPAWFSSALACPKLACSCVHRCPADCAAAASGAASQRVSRRGDANHRPLRRLQHWLWRDGSSYRAAAAGAATRRPGGLPLVGRAPVPATRVSMPSVALCLQPPGCPAVVSQSCPCSPVLLAVPAGTTWAACRPAPGTRRGRGAWSTCGT